MKSHANRHVFSIPMWLLWSCSKAYCKKGVCTTILLPCSVILSITARSLWTVQYGYMYNPPSTLVNDQPLMIYAISTCKSS